MNIFDQIKAGPEGGTVHRTGHALPDHGFFVGGHGESIVFSAGVDFTPDLKSRIETWARVSQSPFFGWWTDEETGKLHLDGTDWFTTEEEARRAAEERHELAFWDVSTQRELRIERKWIAEDVPWYSVSPGQRRMTMTDEDYAMSAPRRLGEFGTGREARLAVAAELDAISIHHVGGEWLMHRAAAETLRQGADGIRISGRYYRVRQEA